MQIEIRGGLWLDSPDSVKPEVAGGLVTLRFGTASTSQGSSPSLYRTTPDEKVTVGVYVVTLTASGDVGPRKWLDIF